MQRYFVQWLACGLGWYDVKEIDRSEYNRCKDTITPGERVIIRTAD